MNRSSAGGASLRCGRCGVFIMQSATCLVIMVLAASSEKFGAQSTPATWSAWWWVSTMRRGFASARWSLANGSAKYGSGLSGLKSVRKRTWQNHDGSQGAAWIVDYVDQSGHRHTKNFARKR